MARTRPLMPAARTEGLVVEEFADEILVYDLKRHEAHCLNRTAALIWRRCDGRTTVAEVAAGLEKELTPPPGEAAVRMALDRLGTAQLLTERVTVPGSYTRHSRRDVIRAAGLSLLLPVVESIVAPRAAEAASSTTSQACQDTCAGLNLPCSDAPGTCRQPVPGTCICS